jgi:purine nucleoside phosphorylase
MTSNTDEQGNRFALLSSISDRGGVVVLVGVIGGSGLYHLDNLTFVCVSETAFQSNF